MTRRLFAAILLVSAATLAGAALGLLADPDRRPWAGLAGALAGLGIALPIALLVRRRSRALKDGADAQRVCGLPLVAHVPPPAPGDADRRRAEEAFRMLRAALVRGAPAPGDDTPPRGGTTVVTSAAPGEGKTTVAAGLARALARAGRPVIAVEADLRRPALAAAFGIDVSGSRGLTAAIVGGVPVEELLVEAGPGLRLLPAGALPPNAPELLGGVDAARVLHELTGLGVDVVLDTAPLLPVADTRELLGHAVEHRVVLVARPGVADRDELRAAVALLPDRDRAVLVVSGRSHAPRSYDRYLADGERP